MSVEANKALVRQMMNRWDKGDPTVIDDLFSPDFVLHLPGGYEVSGHATLKEQMALYLKAFPDLKHTIEDLITEENKLVIRLKAQGTHRGEFMGVAPTGKLIKGTAISICRIDGGKLVEEWVEHDALGWMQQIGVSVQPPQAQCRAELRIRLSPDEQKAT